MCSFSAIKHFLTVSLKKGFHRKAITFSLVYYQLSQLNVKLFIERKASDYYIVRNFQLKFQALYCIDISTSNYKKFPGYSGSQSFLNVFVDCWI